MRRICAASGSLFAASVKNSQRPLRVCQFAGEISGTVIKAANRLRLRRHAGPEGAKKFNVLIMGASYGSLLATRLGLAGHDAHMICLPAEADLINAEGAVVRLPVKGREGLVEVNSRALPGKLTAGGPAGVEPGGYDLVVLAMQEPQYRLAGVRELLDRVAKSRVPCMSIMNMPPLAYLKRIPSIDANAIRAAYTDPSDAQVNANTDAEVFYNGTKIGDLDYKTINNKVEIFIIYSDGTSENVKTYVSDFEQTVRNIFDAYL